MKRTLLLLLLTATAMLSSLYAQYTYEYCVFEKGFSSEIKKNEIAGMMDKTVVSISGKVISQRTRAPLPGCVISIAALDQPIKQELFADQQGEFRLMGKFYEVEITVLYIGYSPLKTNIALRPGEIRELVIELGEGDSWVTYEVESEKKLTQWQVKQRVKQIQRRNKERREQAEND